MATKKKRMSEWNFSPPTLSSLPTDAPSNGTARRNVYGAVFSACRPTPLKEERRLIAVRCGIVEYTLVVTRFFQAVKLTRYAAVLRS